MPDPVEIDVAPELADVVADQLFGMGANAVSEEHLEVDGVQAVRLVADPDPELLATSGIHWRRHDPVPPVPVAPRSSIEVAGVAIHVDSAGAFGSGSHVTTRLCIDLVPAVVTPGASVLDVGSGSGVLGVAAAVLGAAHVVSIDIDPAAAAATVRTSALNTVSDLVVASTTPVGEVEGTFDVVFANLLIPIIEELGSELVGHLASGGHLVVSGILADQEDRATAALLPLVLERRVESDGWVALVLRC